MKKLENNVLEGVNIGDLLCLTAGEDVVCGFVAMMVPGKVKLTQQCPFNERVDYSIFFSHPGSNSSYKLSKFSEYTVIPKNLCSGESSENQKA